MRAKQPRSGKHFDVFPSTEAVLIEAKNGAFAGCISATANLNPDLCQRAWSNGEQSSLDAAVTIRKLFDGKALVSGVKALLAHIHADPALSRVKPPLAPFCGRRSRRRGGRLRPGARQARGLDARRAHECAFRCGDRRRDRRALRRASSPQGRSRRPSLRTDPADHRGGRWACSEPECVAPADPARARRGTRAHRCATLGVPSAALAGRPHTGAFTLAGADRSDIWRAGLCFSPRRIERRPHPGDSQGTRASLASLHQLQRPRRPRRSWVRERRRDQGRHPDRRGRYPFRHPPRIAWRGASALHRLHRVPRPDPHGARGASRHRGRIDELDGSGPAFRALPRR